MLVVSSRCSEQLLTPFECRLALELLAPGFQVEVVVDKQMENRLGHLTVD